MSGTDDPRRCESRGEVQIIGAIRVMAAIPDRLFNRVTTDSTGHQTAVRRSAPTAREGPRAWPGHLPLNATHQKTEVPTAKR